MANRLKDIFSNEPPEYGSTVKFRDNDAYRNFQSALDTVANDGSVVTVDGVESVSLYGGKSMNIRKNIDYTAMYVRINEAMQADLSLMERYFAIGQAAAERPEKGAAVAAAEYIQKNWPDAKGYSPRNLRRMRELYRVYGDCPEAITLAEQIGWTQNVVILEAELDLQERLWYMRAVRQFGWSKLELIEMIENAAHTFECK